MNIVLSLFLYLLCYIALALTGGFLINSAVKEFIKGNYFVFGSYLMMVIYTIVGVIKFAW